MPEIYDLDTLVRGREAIIANIEAIEIALDSEREKLKEYDKHIAKAEAILELHGENPKKNGE